MKIHVHCFYPHYMRHIAPIWNELPDDVKGDFLDPVQPHVYRLPAEDVILIGSGHELDGRQKQRYIYVEHGAGQRYEGLRPNIAAHYHGGEHPPNVVGYVCPRQEVADSWGRPAVVVGCPAIEGMKADMTSRTVAMTFHHDAPRVCPEARSAREHYMDYLHSFVAKVRGDYHGEFIGHAHPRDQWAEGIWEDLQVEFVPDPDEVLQRARLLVADNTSLLYEAAAIGMQTIVLNAPWYRKDVNHGLRFWDAVPGYQIEDPLDLAQVDPSTIWTSTEERKRITQAAYDMKVGGGKLAADFILNLVS